MREASPEDLLEMVAEGQGDSFTFDLLLDRYLVRELDLEVTLHDVEAAGLVLEVEDDIFCLLVTDPELPHPQGRRRCVLSGALSSSE